MSAQSAHDIATEPMTCGATTRVRSADSARLPESARRHGTAAQPRACELPAGHDGGHVTFLAASDGYESWWWLRWGLQTREILHIDPCPAQGNPGAYPDDCLLPDNHVGPHSFEMRVAAPSGVRH
jgi:hypothetical protein